MPTEVKQRKKTPSQKHTDEVSQTSAANCRNDADKVKTEAGNRTGAENPSRSADIKSLMCLLSLVACGALSWAVLRQNEKVSQMEEKYKSLQEKTSSLFDMEAEVLKVSKKLAASEEDLREALSTVSLATTLQQDIATLHGAVTAMQADESSASRDLQTVNARFLNVTETWQQRLAGITSDLAALKAESREAHARSTERVNEAERRARTLAERLQELEDSTKRNARALERTEEDDAKRAQDQLDWNTRQIQKLEEQMSSLTKREVELGFELQEQIPRLQECEEHLPQVEEAVRTILRLGGDLSGAEKRLEELTLQVFGTEDSMLKAVNEILEIRQELDTLRAHSSILKMKNELSVVKEAVRELTMALRENRADGETESDTLEEEDEEWDGVQRMLEDLRDRREPALLQPGGLEQDVQQLKEWASGLTEKRTQLQASLAGLRSAVGQIEERTSAITKDFTNKVASVRTDVRRMDGLQTELETLLAQVAELEDGTTRVERSMVKRVGDVLASSIERVSNLRAASERNTRAIDKLRGNIPELAAADRQISERLRDLEGSRARLIRTLTYASDLKPKVAAIKRDFGAFGPQLSDLTLRIGRLAEDLTHREQEIAELRQTLSNLTAARGDLSVTAKQVSEIADVAEMHAST